MRTIKKYFVEIFGRDFEVFFGKKFKKKFKSWKS